MPVFNNSENKEFKLLPIGDYRFCVTGFSTSISKGSKTSGCDQFKFDLEIEGQGTTVPDTLTDHESCGWRIDTFLKCCNVKLAVGEAFEFVKSKAEERGVRWINPIGLRGWCYLKQEPWQTDPKKFSNKVGVYYTDKEKLAPRVIQEDDVPFN